MSILHEFVTIFEKLFDILQLRISSGYNHRQNFKKAHIGAVTGLGWTVIWVFLTGFKIRIKKILGH